MSHKGNQRGKGRPDKPRPIVQHATAPRAVKAVAPPISVSPAVPEPSVAEGLPPAQPPVIQSAELPPPVPVAPPVAAIIRPPVPAPVAVPQSGTPPHPPNGPRAMNGRAPSPPGSSLASPLSGHPNGHLPVEGKSTKHITQRTATPPGELSEMFETLRALFVRDRTNGSRPDAARCGICYLTFAREELTYHEEAGFYACPDCQQALQARGIAMLRRQRR
ncbi:MAG: hypothetical protein H0X24_15655 [Ktedonobacterales bacterium]|nr:hypothetical protein [Ktedonobacterales bacterium]